MYSWGENDMEELPDSVLLLIFNRVGDVKALGRCCAVSKRFNALVPQVDTVVVKVDCVISGEEGGLSSRSKGFMSHLTRFIGNNIVKPLQHLMGPNKKPSILAEVSHHSPGEVLRSFKEIKHLKIELPGGELGVEDGVHLKWKAEFGSTLESCVIFGAASLQTKGSRASSKRKLQNVEDNHEVSDDSGNIPESFYTNGGLKLRVVWTISSLIAASARHYLLQDIICDHPTLESLVLCDADGQGTLFMGKKQLVDFRNTPLAASASSNRTQVPALNMKLRYSPCLELPCGTIMHGATLVTIRPTDATDAAAAAGAGAPRKDNELSIIGAFNGPFRSAAKMLSRKRTYLLEMNSF